MNEYQTLCATLPPRLLAEFAEQVLLRGADVACADISEIERDDLASEQLDALTADQRRRIRRTYDVYRAAANFICETAELSLA